MAKADKKLSRQLIPARDLAMSDFTVPELTVKVKASDNDNVADMAGNY